MNCTAAAAGVVVPGFLLRLGNFEACRHRQFGLNHLTEVVAVSYTSASFFVYDYVVVIVSSSSVNEIERT